MPSCTRSLLWLMLVGGALVARADEAGLAAKPPGAAALDPLFAKYCLACHSTAKKQGELDLERFATAGDLGADLEVWRNVIDQLHAREMPPKDSPQPGEAERTALVHWTQTLLEKEIRAHAGDPGRVLLRRLSHAEYDNTIRDLTGVDLAPTREFPADGAAGEGFTNAGDGLVMSSVLLNKYLAAAKEVAAHTVLTPSGFRFSPSTYPRDWTDEAIARLRETYAAYDVGLNGGKPDIAAYLRASVVHRDALLSGQTTPQAVAERERLNAKYFSHIWNFFNAPEEKGPLSELRSNSPVDNGSPPLGRGHEGLLSDLRSRWRSARPDDVDPLAADIRDWQSLLWKFNKIGSYASFDWQQARQPTFVAFQQIRATANPAPGQSEVTLYLATRGPLRGRGDRVAAWRSPRFEGAAGPPILLRDVADLARRYELDYREHFKDTAKYLRAVGALSQDAGQSALAIADREGLHAGFLQRWVDFLALPKITTSDTEPLESENKPKLPADSALSAWRAAAIRPSEQERLEELANKVAEVLHGARPAQNGTPNQKLYDLLVRLESPLFDGLDLAHWPKNPAIAEPLPAEFGLDPRRFEADLVVATPSLVELRLPAVLFHDREFTAIGELLRPDEAAGAAQFQATIKKPAGDEPPAGDAPLVGSADLRAFDSSKLDAGLATFRDCFPIYVHYPRIMPDDEIICLRLYYREDDAYQRLCLDEAQARRLDELWRELRVISQWPLVEAKNYPSFFGFVTQETTKQQQDEFDKRTREPVLRRAAEFERELAESAPGQLTTVVNFAARAYRRPLAAEEERRLRSLYAKLRDKDLSHEEALRTLLAGVLVSPAFLYRGETAAAGPAAQPVSSWELATRLSYFLWASLPDDELRATAAAGRLTDPTVLVAQTRRMLSDGKTRGLALEFGAQWLHARGVRDNHEKNERLFPTFDDPLRQALLDETVGFFTDFFQQNRSALELLDADYAFLNEALAKHYDIPGVSGPAWRRVEHVKQFGRGGVLALGSVLTQQSGASRSSPVLRGNWVVEALLGEKIPKPPPDVPKLPESESGDDDLTVRQLVERHAQVASCANCHQRFDPFGFALEKYDPIGRRRERDLAGRPIDTQVELKDGSKFDGLDGLRKYLLSERKADFLRHFCRKLLGYALGRTVSAADQPLVDQMLAALESNDYQIASAIETIVASSQFRNHRGLDATKNE